MWRFVDINQRDRLAHYGMQQARRSPFCPLVENFCLLSHREPPNATFRWCDKLLGLPKHVAGATIPHCFLSRRESPDATFCLRDELLVFT